MKILFLFAVILLSACSTVNTNKSSEYGHTIIDTTHVQFVDTTKNVIEVLDFKKKVVEQFDTVYNSKDSLVVFLKTRTTYEASRANTATAQKGITKNTTAGKVEEKTEVKKFEQERKRYSFGVKLLALAVVVAFVLFVIIPFAKKIFRL